MKKISFLLVTLLAFSSMSYAQKTKKEKKKKNKTEVSKDNGKVLLRYKLKKGDVYTQVVDVNQKITITSMSMEMPNIQSFKIKGNITDVDATGNITTEMVYERIYMKQSNPMTGAEMEFDSDDEKKQSPELAPMLKDMKGKKVTSKTSPNGKIGDVSDEAAKQIVNGSNNEFPETPVGVGDTWERTTESKTQAGILVIKSTYKVLERNAGMMTVEINGKVTQEGKDAGTQTAKMIIEESTGLVMENNITQKLNISAQGMDVLVDSTTKISTKK